VHKPGLVGQERATPAAGDNARSQRHQKKGKPDEVSGHMTVAGKSEEIIARLVPYRQSAVAYVGPPTSEFPCDDSLRLSLQ
jgi:hypothetical protein